MKKNTIIGMMALFVVGMIISVGAVSAYRGDYSVEGPNYTPERHEEMQQAFEDEDYESWYNLMTKDGRHPRVVDVVTEENFDLFIQAHDAGKSGQSETAAAIRAELRGRPRKGGNRAPPRYLAHRNGGQHPGKPDFPGC